MKKVIIFLVILVAGIFIWKFFPSLIKEGATPTSVGAGVVTINNQTFQVALATTPAEQEKGLGGVTKLEKNSGMLFIFPKLDKYGFWMKDTLIPLDMIWIAPSKVAGVDSLEIVFIEKNVTPDTFPTIFTPNTPAMYVLEVNSGVSDEFNFKIGDKVQFSSSK